MKGWVEKFNEQTGEKTICKKIKEETTILEKFKEAKKEGVEFFYPVCKTEEGLSLGNVTKGKRVMVIPKCQEGELIGTIHTHTTGEVPYNFRRPPTASDLQNLLRPPEKEFVCVVYQTPGKKTIDCVRKSDLDREKLSTYSEVEKRLEEEVGELSDEEFDRLWDKRQRLINEIIRESGCRLDIEES